MNAIHKYLIPSTKRPICLKQPQPISSNLNNSPFRQGTGKIYELPPHLHDPRHWFTLAQQQKKHTVDKALPFTRLSKSILPTNTSNSVYNPNYMFRKLAPDSINFLPIYWITCAMVLFDCAGCRIRFYMEWYYFQIIEQKMSFTSKNSFFL